MSGEEDTKNLALIIPHYNYDAQTSKLLSPNDVNRYKQITDHISFENGICSVAHAQSKDITEFIPMNGENRIESNTHVIGNIKGIADLSTSMYQNNSISYVRSYPILTHLGYSFRRKLHHCWK